jgi:hypothetical protein
MPGIQSTGFSPNATMNLSLPKRTRKAPALPPAHSAMLNEAHLSVIGEEAQQVERRCHAN